MRLDGARKAKTEEWTKQPKDDKAICLVNDASILLLCSLIVALSDDTAIDFDIKRQIDALSTWTTDAASLLELLLAYLAQGLQNRFSPKLLVVGAGTLLLDDLLDDFISSSVPLCIIRNMRVKTLEKNAMEVVA